METSTQKLLIITSGALIGLLALIVIIYLLVKDKMAYNSKSSIYSLIGYDSNVGANILDSLMSEFRNKEVTQGYTGNYGSTGSSIDPSSFYQQ